VREALGSALDARDAFVGAHVLDLFAGTGALSFEALSRGAAQAVLVDQDPRAIRESVANAKELGLEANTRAARVDLLADPEEVVRRLPEVEGGFDLVFADAPYAQIESVAAILEALARKDRLAPAAWVVVERPSSYPWIWPNGLAPEAEYRYGQTGISLGRHEAKEGSF
jgi:16S rRNA (guanine966-N2)-methyltransferase